MLTSHAHDQPHSMLEPGLVEALDRLARRLHRSRQELLADAVREYLARHTDSTVGTDKAMPPPKGG